MKEVRRNGDNVLSTFEEFGDGTYEARLYYRQGDGRWQPPLPPDIEQPAETTRSASFAAREITGGPMNELQQAILRAHSATLRGEAGAEKELKRLQAEFRTGSTTIRPGGTVTLNEPGSVTSLRPRRKSRRAVARSRYTPPQKPDWMLGNEGYESWRLR
jgi:hypothetical protein